MIEPVPLTDAMSKEKPKTKNENKNSQGRRQRHRSCSFGMVAIGIALAVSFLTNTRNLRMSTSFVPLLVLEIPQNLSIALHVSLPADNSSLVSEMSKRPSSTSNSLPSSPACQPSLGHKNISRIYFSHTRKAGGTTIRTFLSRIAKKMNLDFVSNEAREQEYPNRADTLYVVNLRDPVARIISQYKYQGRWSCPKMIKNHTKYVPSLANQKTLEEDIQRIVKLNKKLGPRGNGKMWLCVEECYSQWYNKKRGSAYKTVPDRYHHAKQRLMKYDIIVIAEYLKSTEYVKGLESIFGNLDTSSLREKQPIFCSPESDYWNKKYPMGPVNATTLQQLTDWNVYDTKMYKELTDCGGPQSVVFPDASH